MAQNNNTTKGLIIGLLAGSAIGAVVALLYAPKSGKELRADIREKADSLLEEAEGYMQVAKSKASAMVTDAKKRSDQLISDAQKKAQSLIEDADRVLSGARQKVSTVVEEGTKLKNAVKAGVDVYNEERHRT